jgi:hypothetical protein
VWFATPSVFNPQLSDVCHRPPAMAAFSVSHHSSAGTRVAEGFTSCRRLDLPQSGTNAVVDQIRIYLLRMSFLDDGGPISRDIV